ncbi:LysR substrate-binding domain-containing protein [Candidatus Pantoea floridensis]|uniref:DNA-binding transcriptional regulator, LysR family n=1 Tax=Candidatus Pantoea floridensis TaxID=1938870 RepID=A0A286DRG4_9GAMM|nr:LysR substrate-binding domain-containing protein [Pantoea floridensis]PIF07484.1 DNA-binding transcriptional LysR family regulator [Enterobacteriaceae bacterium JKS000233]SOD61252.1 DNA-binding transcriptional regulator, LysR family [Pantoea floridensis]
MKKRNLPPLNALRLFETAALSGSLSAAARELGITHGAVSRQIKLLEEWLGQPLFERQGQRSVAAEHARAFAAEISAAFDIISDASIRFGKTLNTRVIRVNAQTTLAMHWLIPRLPEFHSQNPDIEVSVSTSNSSEVKGLSGFDVLIRREPLDKPEWRYFDKRPLFEEHLTLLAAPKLLSNLPLAGPEDLSTHVFVTSHTRVGEWERWMKIAKIEALRPLRFQRFEHNYISLQAVIDGIGVGIGGLPTLGHDVKEKRLLAPFPVEVKGSKYVALIAPDVDKSLALNLFLEWLEQEASR